MFKINEDMSIYVTRGDSVYFGVTLRDETSETDYVFKAGEVVRFKVVEKKACENVMFYKDFPITEDTLKVDIFLDEDETRIGDVISKPTDYWYEVELNPFENPQTIIGYDDDGAKIFKLFPEGKDVEKEPITPEDIPLVDTELDMTSNRPVENQAIARAIVELQASAKTIEETISKSGNTNVFHGSASVEAEGLKILQENATHFADQTNKTLGDLIQALGGLSFVRVNGKYEDIPVEERIPNTLYITTE